MNVIKSSLVTLGVVVLGALGILLIVQLEQKIGIMSIASTILMIVGGVVLVGGFIIRFWAAHIFYSNNIEVIALKPQKSLMVYGPFRFSRNPLVLGIVCIVFGLALIFGSLGGILLSVLVFVFWDIWIRTVEEKELESVFGDEYRQYKKAIPRWVGFRNK